MATVDELLLGKVLNQVCNRIAVVLMTVDNLNDLIHIKRGCG